MKKIIPIIILCVSLIILAVSCKTTTGASAVITREGAQGAASGKQAIIFIAQENFRDDIFTVITNTLLDAGATLTIASFNDGPAQGMMDMIVDNCIGYKKLHIENYDALVLSDGHGIWQAWDDGELQQFCIKFAQTGKLVAAIGSAPGVLAGAGLLQDKHAIMWELQVARLTQFGAIVDQGQAWVCDGNIITGGNPSGTIPLQFSRAVVQYLADPSVLHTQQ